MFYSSDYLSNVSSSHLLLLSIHSRQGRVSIPGCIQIKHPYTRKGNKADPQPLATTYALVHHQEAPLNTIEISSIKHTNCIK